MRLRFDLLFLLLLLAAPAAPMAGQKVYVDYDRATPFSQLGTFQFVETQEDLRDTSPTLHRQVVTTLRERLRDGGLEEVEENPDVYVAYYTADRRRLQLLMSDLRYSYGPNWTLGGYWRGGVGTRTPQDFTFDQGTLVIDVWNVADQQLIWRGIATAAVSDKLEKNSKRIDKALKKILEQWDEMYGSYSRRLRLQQQGKSPED